jgi:hypothetical protein
MIAPFASRLSLGGHLELNAPFTDDTYEVWSTAINTWRSRVYEGPTYVHGASSVSALYAYPRTLLLSNAHVFSAGMYGDRVSAPPPYRSAALNPPYDPPGTVLPDWRLRGFDTDARIYGTAVLFPNVAPVYRDTVMSLGGIGGQANVLDKVVLCKASAGASGSFPTGHDWFALPSMTSPRVFLNAVLTPNAAVLVIGGSSDPAMMTPVFAAEWYRNGAWDRLASMSVPRTYHSTALLLPKGTVTAAGGEGAGLLASQTFHPPYLFCGPRPMWEAPFPPENLVYGQSYEAYVDLSTGVVVSKIVLMRAGSVTHHFDQDQRYVEVPVDQSNEGTFVAFDVPTNRDELPPGYYMGFLITDTGVPSEARWFRLQ